MVYLEQCLSASCSQATCNTEDLPRTYLAYHLNGQTINIDGKLDDPAWEAVPWTENFVDIRGAEYPVPYFTTKVKARWDDQRLYVGARMQETHFWGNFTQDESPLWQENAFELFVVPDGSMHNYKELQISVRNVSWDLLLRKAYMDFGDACGDKYSLADSSWDSHMVKATYTDGIVNDINGTGTYWSAEWSFSFAALANHTNKQSSRSAPDAGEVWFFEFARPEYKPKVVNGQYVKDENAATEWWSWQPTGAINLHIPSRFGLVQFKKDMSDKNFNFDKWHIYRALFEVFEAQHKYKSVNGMFIESLSELHVPPKFMSTDCVNIAVQVNDTDFTVSVTSRVNNTLPTGHIRKDRYVWFG